MVARLLPQRVLAIICLLLRATFAIPADDDSSIYSSVAPSAPRDDIDSLTAANSSISNASPPLGNFKSFESTGTGVDLLSANSHILGVGDADLYALPISTQQLQSILTTAQEDLNTKLKPATTTFYQWNDTHWSFQVVLAPGQTLRYGAILHIVDSYLKKTPDPAITNWTSTFVGRVEKGSVPVADVVFIPQDPGPEAIVSFTNTTEISEAANNDYLVDTLTADGSSLTWEPFDPTALDFLNATAPTDILPKRQINDIERVIFREIGACVWMLTFKVGRGAIARGDRVIIYKTSVYFILAAIGSALDEFRVFKIGNLLVPGQWVGQQIASLKAYFQIGRVAVNYDMRLVNLPPGVDGDKGEIMRQLTLAMREQLTLSDPKRKVRGFGGDIYFRVLGPEGLGQMTWAGDVNVTVVEALPGGGD